MLPHLALVLLLVVPSADAAEDTRPRPETTPAVEPSPERDAATEPREPEVEPPSRPADAVRAHVTRVIDGDTLVVKDLEGMKHVRLIGVDCPERFSKDPREKALARKAAVRVAQFVEDSRVWLELDEETEDKYERLLAYVWFRSRGKDLLLNAELVQAGLAKVERHAPNLKHHEFLLSLQGEARAERCGIFAESEGGDFVPYRIVAKEDVSHGQYAGRHLRLEARRRMRVHVILQQEEEPKAEAVERVAEKVWEPIKDKYDDVFIFIWLPDQERGAELAYATVDYTKEGLKELMLQDEAYRTAREIERLQKKRRR